MRRAYKEASRCILNDLQMIEWRFIDSISEQHIAVVQPGTNTSIDYLLQIVKREERFDFGQKLAFTTEFTCLSSLRIYTNSIMYEHKYNLFGIDIFRNVQYRVDILNNVFFPLCYMLN